MVRAREEQDAPKRRWTRGECSFPWNCSAPLSRWRSFIRSVIARITVLLSLATAACHDLAIASYQGQGTGEMSLFRRMYDTLKPGYIVVADAVFDDYFIAWELYKRDIDIVARVQYKRTDSWITERRSDSDLVVWQHPSKPREMTRAQRNLQLAASRILHGGDF